MPAIVEFDTLPQLFDGLVDHYEGQNRTALRYWDRDDKAWGSIDWETFRDNVHAMAGYLYSRGIRHGDRVAILSENRPEWVYTDMATQLLGGINVSLYTSLPASQVAYIIHDSGAKIFVVSTGIQFKKAKEIFNLCPELSEVVTMTEPKKDIPGYTQMFVTAMKTGAQAYEDYGDEIARQRKAVEPDDIACLIYTSGTTGNPKGVMLTHGNLCENTKSALTAVPFGNEDHHLSFLPLCHSFERTAGYAAVLACGGMITYAQSIDSVSRDLMDVKPTVMISVPTLFERIYNLIFKSVQEGSAVKRAIFNWSLRAGKQFADKKLSGRSPGPILKTKKALAHKLVFSKLHEKLGGNLRFAVSGGAALPKTVGEFFLAAGITIVEGYGLTETSPVLTISPFDKPRYGSVGHVIDGVTVGIHSLTENSIIGQLCGEDYPSNLTTEAGEVVAKGPNIMKGYWNNDEATRESIDEDGWYHTGDIGRFDDGYLLITDRIKHMIVSKGGENIYPGPIEEGFKSEPCIDQLMVVGEGRKYLTALVVPDEDSVRRYGKENGIESSEFGELLEADEIKKIYSDLFRSYSRQAAGHEKIRDFRFIREAFSVENGMMTPTLKLKRNVIAQNYADLIEEMYANVV